NVAPTSISASTPQAAFCASRKLAWPINQGQSTAAKSIASDVTRTTSLADKPSAAGAMPPRINTRHVATCSNRPGAGNVSNSSSAAVANTYNTTRRTATITGTIAEAVSSGTIEAIRSIDTATGQAEAAPTRNST